MNPLRVLMAGGGTAGHLFPCLAVAEELAELAEDLQVHYVGAVGRIDAEVLAERGLPHDLLPALPLPYRMSAEAIAGFRALVRSTLLSRRIIGRFRPDVLFSTGGFVGAPVALAARLARVPVVLHVADALPDRSNRMLARWATAITAASPAAGSRLERPVIVTGHPIRREVALAQRGPARSQFGMSGEQLLIAVTGGSQGARTLNRAVVDALGHLLEQLGARIVHLCGSLDYEDLRREVAERYGQAPGYDLIERLADTGPLLAAADLIICRAGAASIAEACLHALPMIVVPYPFAGGHQRFNAEPLVEAGAAVMIEDADFTGERLIQIADELVGESGRLARMSEAARAAAYPWAARDVARVVAQAAGRPLADQPANG